MKVETGIHYPLIKKENIMTAQLPCRVCKGTKVIIFQLSGSIYTCRSCNEGYFSPPDREKILSRIVAKQGKNKGNIRAAMTSCTAASSIDEARAYYVWRLARFHGGKDTTMPVAADMCVRGDPYKGELDKLADEVAKEHFGTDKAAALMWGRALGLV